MIIFFLNQYINKPLLFLVALFTACQVPGNSQTSQANPGKDIVLADPAIFYHQGMYYLYGTGGNAATNQGFVVYTSKDLKNWEGPKGAKNGYALTKGDAFGENKFWAPQVFQYKNKFYMAYAASEKIAIAESESPLGPFTQANKKPLEAPTKQIDPFVFIDDDGKKYLYHVKVANGGNRMYVAELSDDFSGIKPETLKLCVEATENWENTEKDAWSVTEGPSVLKHKGRYYFVYSANHFRSKDYAVGYAVSDSPYGPWKKYSGNPILSRANIGQNGTGHGDFTKDKQGNLIYVFHTHQSDTAIGPRKTAVVRMQFIKDKKSKVDKLQVTDKSFNFLKTDK